MKISVVIPVYNAAKYIKDCLNSVLAQDIQGLEVVCVDDGSEDDSLAILKTLAEEDPRLRVESQQNSGAGPARNRGLKIAQGEFVAFMDPDDWYPEPSTLRYLYECAVTANADICGGGWCTVDQDGKVTDQFRGLASSLNKFNPPGFVEYADYQGYLGYTRFIYRRRLLLDHDITFPNYRRFQDPVFFVRAMLAAGRFYGVDKVTYCYRIDYKNVNWAARRCMRLVDCLKGMCDVLSLARNHGLLKLQALMFTRCNTNYFTRILNKGLYTNPEVFSYLRLLNALFDRKALKEKGMIPESAGKLRCLKWFVDEVRVIRKVVRALRFVRMAHVKVRTILGLE